MGGSPTTSAHVSSYYNTHKNITRATRVEEVFTARSINDMLNPSMLKNGYRESCDSVDSPNSRAVAIGFDDTGSMGQIPFDFIKNGFPNFIKMIQGGALGYDPHILFAAIGDVKCDNAPLQVTQFEADTRMLDQLRLFYIERGGGGNGGESYQIPWYFLAKHTKIDCFNKRGQKGVYISIGDDKPHEYTSKDQFEEVFGEKASIEVPKLSMTQLRDMALEKWHLFHILLPEDGYGSDYVERTWTKLLGNHIVILNDHQYVAETMATILKMQNGVGKNEAINMIESDKARKVIREAMRTFEVYSDDATAPTEATGQVEYI